MSRFQWSEVFGSIEGEARYSGQPTVFVRFTGCNFTCAGFSNPGRKEITNERLGFDPGAHRSLATLPIAPLGCDSIYSWDSRFRHLWSEGDAAELARAIVAQLPQRAWRHPVTGRDVILSLTGGEPTLRSKTIPTLLAEPALEDVQRLLIETNAALPLPHVFLSELSAWTHERVGRRVIWSNSPKLSPSGETWEEAIKPEVATSQMRIPSAEQYFKFVCGADPADFDEVDRAMRTFHDAGVSKSADVYVMPVANTEGQQHAIAAQIAHLCLERGYIYCHRVHSTVFGNAIGT